MADTKVITEYSHNSLQPYTGTQQKFLDAKLLALMDFPTIARVSQIPDVTAIRAAVDWDTHSHTSLTPYSGATTKFLDATLLDDLLARIDAGAGGGTGGGSVSTLITSVTYAQLVSLVGSATLVPGMLYRITNYTCTTSQANTTVKGRYFDIIVLALTTSKLSEDAYAAHSVRDTANVFTSCNLSAWRLKYSLQGGSTLFSWGGNVNSTGTIYYMKDEWGNECGYDFKNIAYLRGGEYVFTFGTSSIDDTILGNSYNNVIAPKLAGKKYYLPLNVFGMSCYNNKLGNNCESNVFGTGCHTNTLGSFSLSNTFGNNCYIITLDEVCNGNVFSADCYNIILLKRSGYNTFNNGGYKHRLGYNCTNNTISVPYECTMGNSCSYNNIGVDAGIVTIGNHSSYNTINTAHIVNIGIACVNNRFDGTSGSGISANLVLLVKDNVSGIDLYDNVLASTPTVVTYEMDMSHKYIMYWRIDGLTYAGKYKTNYTDTFWTAIL